jgi:prepilin-type N-terminal cleavage/methylation domain-containing protein
MTRAGTTLLELLLALAILAALAGVALPRVATILDGARVRAARSDLHAALDRARGAAIRLGTGVELRDDGTGRILVPDPPDTAPIWRGPSAASHGVAEAGWNAPLAFGAAGLATGAGNRTVTLRRGSVQAQVVISRLGRIR